MYFPYTYIYPEQLAYMRELKKAIDAKVFGCRPFTYLFKRLGTLYD